MVPFYMLRNMSQSRTIQDKVNPRVNPRPKVNHSVTGVSFPEVFDDLKDAGHHNEAGEEDDCHSE